MTDRFPDGFLWGAATAAHQVEGGNCNSDCWALEQADPSLFREKSGDGVDQWNRFADDAAVVAALGLGAYRFSIEWARVEPEQGVFAQSALDHYQRCIDACLERGIVPVITFHHFTQPLWQARRGGMTDARFPDSFARYCERAARFLRGFDYACTLNELNLPLFVRDVMGARLTSPQGHARRAAAEIVLGGSLDSFFLFSPRASILDHGLLAHAKARDAIKSAHPRCQVGVTLAIQDEHAEPGAETLRDRRNQDFYDVCLDFVRGDDFIGVQNYTRVVVGTNGQAGPAPGHARTMMGYEDRPQALAAVCRRVWRLTQTPILVTENGWAGLDDERRTAFIREALCELLAAIKDGVDVRGYLYWSLLDNYEWMAGYGPKFGLVGVDRTTQRRQIKGSALALGRIARANALDTEDAPAPSASGPSSAAPIGLAGDN